MKKITFLLLIPLLILTAGCGRKTTPSWFPAVEKSTPSQPPGGELGGEVTQPTKPPTAPSKLGAIVRIRSYRYGLEGLVQIKTPDTIQITHFSYNGRCPQTPLIYLTLSSDPTKILADITPANFRNRQYRDETLVLKIPESLNLESFDAIAFSCGEEKEPFSVGDFEE